MIAIVKPFKLYVVRAINDIRELEGMDNNYYRIKVYNFGVLQFRIRAHVISLK